MTNLTSSPLSAQEIIAQRGAEYEPLAMALLAQIGELCTERGLHVGAPADMTGDEFCWTMLAWLPQHADRAPENSVAISVQVPEAVAYGDEPESGISFALDMVAWGGNIIGGLHPYNYTDECWVDAYDEAAVKARWAEIATADLKQIPELIITDHA